MTEEKFLLGRIPAVLYGKPSQQVYLFVHGQCGCKEEGAAFAEVVCPKGLQVLAVDLPEHGARRGETERLNPWTAVPELRAVLEFAKPRWSEIGLRANSIGAHFSLLAFAGEPLCRALLVSPILDMERLISDLMRAAGVTEQELAARGEIETDFGQTLSCRYLSWERRHPLKNWRCPTAILCAGRDGMTGRETAERFAADHDASLTVMENGEHWFHTPEQLAVLRAWEDAETRPGALGQSAAERAGSKSRGGGDA